MNRIGLLEQEDALDQYFQTLLFNELQDGEPEPSAVELSEIILEDQSNYCRQDRDSSEASN